MKNLIEIESAIHTVLLRLGKVMIGLTFCAPFLLGQVSRASTVSWLANPVDNNWNNPANWSTGRVPISSDEVRLGASAIRDLTIPEPAGVFDLVFEADAEAYTITAQPGASLGFSSNLINESTFEQNFIAASDGTEPAFFGCTGSSDNNDGTITGPITFTQQAGNGGSGLQTIFQFVFYDAGDATIHNLGASVAGGSGGLTTFFYTGTSAANSTIINDGATAAGATGGQTEFDITSPDAGNATLIAYGGTNGGGGGNVRLNDASLGGTARVEVFGNGYLDISGHSLSKDGTVTVGSIEGDGQIYLGKLVLVVGSNSLSTTFSGVLHPAGPDGGGGGGALSKTGTGTLSLTGANLYVNGTTVTQGVLRVSNTAGSGTGTGPLNVNAGTLGGSGIIAGAVTVGTGSGPGAFLTPGIGTNKQLTLIIQSPVTFNSDAAYTYTFKGNKNRMRTDLVIANGVTINGGTIAISSSSQNRMRRGTVLTVISNTSANAISGAFSNLPDGAIVTVNGNNLQASYEGGDGNDLTLTVVP